MTPDFTRFFKKVQADIERVGWSSVGVFPTEGDEPVTFTYTIGLTETLDHPELIVYGLPAEQAHGILASAIEQVREGVRFEPGSRYPKVLVDFDVETREVDPPGRPLYMARAYYDRDVEAVQLVWPDKAGLFPGDEGVDEAYAAAQKQVAE